MTFVDKDLKILSKPSVTPSLRAIKEDRLAVNVKDTVSISIWTTLWLTGRKSLCWSYIQVEIAY